MTNRNGTLSHYNYSEIEFSFLSKDIQFLPKQVQQFVIETTTESELKKRLPFVV
jgi:hypothetical protein